MSIAKSHRVLPVPLSSSSNLTSSWDVKRRCNLKPAAAAHFPSPSVRMAPVMDENKKEECGRRNGLITSVYMCSFKEGDPCTTPEVYRLTSRFMSC